jgi:SAM-dependent methyltransferase
VGTDSAAEVPGPDPDATRQTARDSVPDRLLLRTDDPDRPSLENRVAFQFEGPHDTLGGRSARLRDATTIGWAAEGLERAERPARFLDVGCSYGNFQLMLDARMGRDPEISYVGMDIDERAMQYGIDFAATIPGYQNCSFQVADLTAKLPFPDQSFDVILAADVIEHLPDVVAVLTELRRLLRMGGRLIVSTPVEDSYFKVVAATANRATGGRLNRSYYRGKGTELSADGRPIMDVHAGHDHISEMGYRQLLEAGRRAGLGAVRERPMSVMSGSEWFDRHPFLLAALFGLEAIHERVQAPRWGHGICVEFAANS